MNYNPEDMEAFANLHMPLRALGEEERLHELVALLVRLDAHMQAFESGAVRIEKAQESANDTFRDLYHMFEVMKKPDAVDRNKIMSFQLEFFPKRREIKQLHILNEKLIELFNDKGVPPKYAHHIKNILSEVENSGEWVANKAEQAGEALIEKIRNGEKFTAGLKTHGVDPKA